MNEKVQPYFESKDQLTIMDGIIYKGMRIVIPHSMWKDMLKLIHSSHLGIVKCKQRGREVFYWPLMGAQIEEQVRNCERCAEIQNKQPREPLRPTKLPKLPFAELSADIFEFESTNYLITVDFYSNFIQTTKLTNMRCSSVIDAFKQQISVHGIPTKITTDCGTQFTSHE